MELIRDNDTLTKIGFHMEWNRAISDIDDDNVDTLANALVHNSSLTSVQIKCGDRHQSHLEYICRFFCNRNRLRTLVDQDQITLALWPAVIKALGPDPSCIFDTMLFWHRLVLIKGQVSKNVASTTPVGA